MFYYQPLPAGVTKVADCLRIKFLHSVSRDVSAVLLARLLCGNVKLMASPLGDGLEILRSWSWFGKNRIAGWIQLGGGDEFMKCGCSEGEKELKSSRKTENCLV